MTTQSSMVVPKTVLNFQPPLDARVTFARSLATATVVNANGLVETVAADTPRFDYDPVTRALKGLLIEEQRTNLIPFSEDFSNAAWTKTRLTIAQNAAVAPDGAMTADKTVDDTTTNNRSVNHRTALGSTTNTNPYTASIYLKEAGRGFATLFFYEGATYARYSSVGVNLATGNLSAVANVGGASGAAVVEDAGNGWWRVSFAVTLGGTATRVQFNVFTATFLTNQLPSYTGDGASGIYIWGAQLEAGAFPTSYIPNLASGSTTRNADVAAITGTNFSDWWQATRGGVLVRARPGAVSGTRPWVQFDNGTADNIIALRGNTTNPELYIVDGGTPQAQIDAGTIAANTDYSLTGWWATNDCKAQLDSGAVVTDTSATIPTVTQARLGSDGTNYLNGHLASISYYNTFSDQIYTRRKNKAVFNLM